MSTTEGTSLYRRWRRENRRIRGPGTNDDPDCHLLFRIRHQRHRPEKRNQRAVSRPSGSRGSAVPLPRHGGGHRIRDDGPRSTTGQGVGPVGVGGRGMARVRGRCRFGGTRRGRGRGRPRAAVRGGRSVCDGGQRSVLGAPGRALRRSQRQARIRFYRCGRYGGRRGGRGRGSTLGHHRSRRGLVFRCRRGRAHCAATAWSGPDGPTGAPLDPVRRRSSLRCKRWISTRGGALGPPAGGADGDGRLCVSGGRGGAGRRRSGLDRPLWCLARGRRSGGRSPFRASVPHRSCSDSAYSYFCPSFRSCRSQPAPGSSFVRTPSRLCSC